MKRFFSFLFSIVFVINMLYIVVYADEPQDNDNQSSDIKNITIVNTNDINSYIDESEDNENIGLEKLSGFYHSVGGDILLDSGNIFFGQSIYSADRGITIAKAISNIGYTAISLGINDWTYGSENVLMLQQISNIDFLTSNVLYFENQENFFNSYKIVDVDGIKVGIFGVIDDYYYYSRYYELRKDVYFYDEKEFANKIAAELLENEKCDFIICMANVKDYKDFSDNVSGINLVLLSNQSNDSINYKNNDTIYFSCKENLSQIGVTNISFMVNNDEKTLLSVSNELYSYQNLFETPIDKNFKNTYNNIKVEQSKYLNTVIANANNTISGTNDNIHYTQTEIGALITNAYLSLTEADIAFELSGSIGLSIPKGNVTINNCINIINKDMKVVTKNLSGQEILDTLELMIDFSLKNQDFYNNSGNKSKYPLSYMQFGGMKVYYNKDNLFGRRVTLVRIGNKDINLDKIYTVAMSEDVSNSTDFLIISSKTVRKTFCNCGEAILDYVRNNGIPSNLNENRYFQEEKPRVESDLTPPSTNETKSYSYIAYILIVALLASAIGSVYLKNKSIIRNKKK